MANVLIAGFAALQLADILTTKVGTDMGCMEINPIARRFGLARLYALKVLYAAFGVAYFVTFPDERWVLLISLAGMSALVLWNISQLLKMMLDRKGRNMI